MIDNGDGNYIYVPRPDFEGLDSFSYTVEDPSGAQATAVIYVNVYSEVLDSGLAASPVDSTVEPMPSTGGTGPGPLEIVPGSQTDTATPVADDTDPLKTASEYSGGHGGTGIPTGVGDPGFSTSTFGLTADAVLLDEQGDGHAKSKPQKFLYDGILDGFEFQGFGMNTVGVNQDILWQALDDMQRQMSGLNESSDRSFLISSVMGGSSLLLTTGLISWVLRGGALASTLLSTLPLWRGMDPLPLLAGRKKKDRKKKNKDAITDTQVMDRSQEVGHSGAVRNEEQMFADSDTHKDDSRGAG